MENRENDTGRYAFSNFELMCVCGHNLGMHDAERTKTHQYCQNSESLDGDGKPCECIRFTKAVA